MGSQSYPPNTHQRHTIERSPSVSHFPTHKKIATVHAAPPISWEVFSSRVGLEIQSMTKNTYEQLSVTSNNTNTNSKTKTKKILDFSSKFFRVSVKTIQCQY